MARLHVGRGRVRIAAPAVLQDCRPGRHAPAVIDASDLIGDPEVTIRAYCDAVGIRFVAEVLEWSQGEPTEVSWYGEGAGPWHDKLRQSTGIQPPRTEYPPLEAIPRLYELYERCLPLYHAMAAHKLPPTMP